MDIQSTSKNSANENSIFVNKTLKVLRNGIKNIGTVTEWAKKAGYSRPYFCFKFMQEFQEKPSEYLRQVRFDHICTSIAKHPDATSSAIASFSGLKDEQALYIFLSTYHDTNFTKLREKVLAEAYDLHNFS